MIFQKYIFNRPRLALAATVVALFAAGAYATTHNRWHHQTPAPKKAEPIDPITLVHLAGRDFTQCAQQKFPGYEVGSLSDPEDSVYKLTVYKRFSHVAYESVLYSGQINFLVVISSSEGSQKLKVEYKDLSSQNPQQRTFSAERPQETMPQAGDRIALRLNLRGCESVLTP